MQVFLLFVWCVRRCIKFYDEAKIKNTHDLNMKVIYIFELLGLHQGCYFTKLKLLKNNRRFRQHL